MQESSRRRRARSGAPKLAAIALAGALALATGTAATALCPGQAHAGLTIVGASEDGAISDALSRDGVVASSSTPDASAAADVGSARHLSAGQIADGDYDIQVDSSSSMFRVVAARLHVSGDRMTCTLTLGGTGYGKLFMGTSEQAGEASEDECVPYVEDDQGAYTYTVDVDELNVDTACAAWSTRKQRWYDRTLVFRSDSIPAYAIEGGAGAGTASSTPDGAAASDAGKGAPEAGGCTAGDDAGSSSGVSADQDGMTEAGGALADGTYEVDVRLTGGSGRAQVLSPALIRVEGSSITATITWSSSSYDRMTVDGVDYAPVSTDGGSTFEIPIAALDADLPVSAETLAMGTPHTIDYTLRLTLADGDAAASGADSSASADDPGAVGHDAGGSAGQGDAGATSAVASSASDARGAGTSSGVSGRDTSLGIGWVPSSTMDVRHATQFAVDYYDGGYELLTIGNGEQFLVVPEGADVPRGISGSVSVLRRPLDGLYVAASSMLCLIDALDAVDDVAVLGVSPQNCSVSSFTDAVGDGTMAFGGTYSSPDYELLVASGCDLAVESTMINHSPDVRDKLTQLGIPVLTELSSYEPDPLGRLEWVRLMGALLDRQDEADALYDAQEQQVLDVEAQSADAGGKSVAFFSVDSSGNVVTHRPGGYMAQTIEAAGGTYAFDALSSAAGDAGGGSSASTVTVEAESFLAIARDADVIIYNGTIDGGVSSVDELLGRCPQLAGCKAVAQGDVWCMGSDVYQQMTSTAQVIADIHDVLTDPDAAEPTYLSRLG